MPVVAVIDTSVWVSAFLNPDGHPARLIQAGTAAGFAIVGSLPLPCAIGHKLFAIGQFGGWRVADGDNRPGVQGSGHEGLLVVE